MEARGLVVAYGERQALDGVSLTVPAGPAFALLGPNGSGKTTLLSVIVGLQAPQSGTVQVLGRPPGPRARAEVGVVFQESCLDPLMTVEETLRLQARLFGLRAGEARERIAALLAGFGLAERAREATRTLSGGLKRRLELARALLPSPALLLLDEPTTGLDPDARLALWEHLNEVKAAGTTLLVATNDVAEAERHCDTVAFLDRGRLVAQGSPAELKRDLKRDSVRVEWLAFPDSAGLEAVSSLPGVGKATWAPPFLHVTVDSAGAFVPRLFQLAGEGIRSVGIHESTLEDAYFQIVGAPLSGEAGA
ncbi:MAG: ABC transporter ATP-binding protein [Chloroflexi bacterium]|nr:ABC transporter ATP-binding protein [Chloroflexota bacterium]